MSGRSRGEEGDGSLGGGREKREKRGHDLNPKVDITPRKENKEGGGLGGVFPPSAGCRTHAVGGGDDRRAQTAQTACPPLARLAPRQNEQRPYLAASFRADGSEAEASTFSSSLLPPVVFLPVPPRSQGERGMGLGREGEGKRSGASSSSFVAFPLFPLPC